MSSVIASGESCQASINKSHISVSETIFVLFGDKDVTFRLSSNETPIEQYNKAPLANRTVIYKHTPERETY